MQSQQRQGQGTTVQLILEKKLDEIQKQYIHLLEIIKAVNGCISKAEMRLMNLEVTSSTMETVRLATYVDLIQENLSISKKSLETLTKFNFDENTSEQPANEDFNSPSTTGFDILYAQLLELKENMTKRFETVEDHLSLLDQSTDSRLQNAEAKQLLIVQIQLRNDEECNRLAAQQKSFGDDLNKVKKKIDSLQKLRDALNQTHKNISSRAEIAENITEMKKKMEDFKQMVLILQQDQLKENVMSAFVAEATSKTIVTSGNIIHFSIVNFNKRNCYDHKTSKFKAQIPGLYYFSVSINTNTMGLLTVAISHMGNQVALCATPDGQDFQTSTSVLLELSAGDEVWVEADSITPKNKMEIGGGVSNFLGFQIR
ncbi:unnamed protein product [Lymnaea stagnalis]|uniref:C1q domain-containing protein n=1 Tax=Lymnaea stagnalis TaxID=6523 RepID=A0AAV2HWH6_LYMST